MLTAPASLPGSGRSWTGAAAEALAGQRAGPGSYNSVVTVFYGGFPLVVDVFYGRPKMAGRSECCLASLFAWQINPPWATLVAICNMVMVLQQWVVLVKSPCVCSILIPRALYQHGCTTSSACILSIQHCDMTSIVWSDNINRPTTLWVKKNKTSNSCP